MIRSWPVIPLLLSTALCAASVFDLPEPNVAPSPAQPRQVRLAGGVRVLDTDVSPLGGKVAVLVANASGTREILIWDIGQPDQQQPPTRIWAVPDGLAARTLAWHPLGNALFVAGEQAGEYRIEKVEWKDGAWAGREIYSSPREIRRLVAGPRPFLVLDANGKDETLTYRLFFGLKATDGRYSIHSITEEGKVDYQVIGRREGITKIADADVQPSALEATAALPVGFHPAGHLLVWENEKNCFEVARYGRDHWEKSSKLLGRDVCGGTVSVTPNGIGLLHWTAGQDGVDLLVEHGAVVERHQGAGHPWVAPPSPLPDGRGMVGVTRTTQPAGFALDYVPIQVPLADVVNAWMYLESGRDAELLDRNGGLFRDLKQMDQLYSLYDTESYYCGGYDQSTPTRPYLVTTDSFWELFAAAYEGIFIVRERQVAMPAFWQFVAGAHASLSRSHPQSRWTQVFAALAALESDNPGRNPEAGRILQAAGRLNSPVLREEFDYGELKPRGHYTATPAAQTYFRAFRYLTRVSALGWPMDELRELPPDSRSAAARWIAAYQDAISSSRAPLLWESQWTPPPYIRHPQTAARLFPLSWGFDNETLYSTVYHADAPGAERIEGPSGPRMLPSALDVAAALGSRVARELLSGEIAKYPRLGAALADLNARLHATPDAARPNLYDRWIEALGQQWADSTPSPNGAADERLWRAKRLQTGLASWATLRHATVLVNERIAAECGEAGFEAIVMRPPRGYVEPDPLTFSRIASLFDAATRLVSSDKTAWTGTIPPEPDAERESRQALKQGLIRRLTETAAKARLFQAMAAKEVRGEALTATEYEEILYFGRVAEHHFLVFKSLANKDLALSTPNPVPKIVDVADVRGSAPYWLVAVGRPLEWDHNVPYFGRHEMVKGAAYSFYEFPSNSLLTDQEWVKKVSSQPHPAWVAGYVSPDALSCPARSPF